MNYLACMAKTYATVLIAFVARFFVFCFVLFFVCSFVLGGFFGGGIAMWVNSNNVSVVEIIVAKTFLFGPWICFSWFPLWLGMVYCSRTLPEVLPSPRSATPLRTGCLEPPPPWFSADWSEELCRHSQWSHSESSLQIWPPKAIIILLVIFKRIFKFLTKT